MGKQTLADIDANFAWITFLLSFFLSVQLLHKLSIRGVSGSEKLLKVIKVHELYAAHPLYIVADHLT